ncbi:MAG: alpha/beta hydrolase [Alphaproteobacteria bacterium]|nr:alpha/beta hydrolase [Alphaproteobacteria bacterium]
MSRPIVLLHGSPGAPNAWKGVIKALGEGIIVIAPGLPDHNQPHPPQRRETAEMAATIAAELGPQPDGIVLAAHSYGGNVALQMALWGAVKIAALILIEPVALAILPVLGEEAAYREARILFDRYIAKGRAGEADAVGIMINFWFGAEAFGRMPPPVQGFLRSQTEVNLRDVEATFREHHTREQLASLSMPMTVAYGTRSPDVAKLVARRLAATVQSGKAVPLEGADHGMLATHAPQVAALIRETEVR